MKVLVVDFWSDGNIGDAIMQCEILEQCTEVSKDVHVISCFGNNQFQINAFNESLNFDNVTWHPGYFGTYIKLDKYVESNDKSRKLRLAKTLFSLIGANTKLFFYKLTKNKMFLGGMSKLLDIQFDAIVFNGRNYRDFNGKIKNYINNQPLLIHQKMCHELFPNTRKINAGFSAWEFEPEVKYVIENLWCNNDLNIARENYTASFLENEKIKKTECRKDLSFDYLSNRVVLKENIVRKQVAFSLTSVSNYELYMEQVNSVLQHFHRKGFDLILVDQVYLVHESVEHLLPLIKVPYKRVSSKKIQVILDAYKGCEYVVSTRMHGSIMALSQGCRVASIAYDDGAKWSIITDEINQYPIFKPGCSKSEMIVKYLESDESINDTKKFSETLRNNNEKYIKKFLCDFNS